MPIYKSNDLDFRPVNKSDKLSITDIVRLRTVIKNAKKTYIYHYHSTFNDSVNISYEADTSIASFDIFGTCISDADYVQMLEALLLESNKLLKQHTKFKYRKFQFDIVGNWTKGKISLFIKKEKGKA